MAESPSPGGFLDASAASRTRGAARRTAARESARQTQRDARAAKGAMAECGHAMARLLLLAMAAGGTLWLVGRAAYTATGRLAGAAQQVHPAVANKRAGPRLVGSLDADSVDLGLPAHLAASDVQAVGSRAVDRGITSSAASAFGAGVGPEVVPTAPPPPTAAAEGKWWHVKHLWPFGQKSSHERRRRREGAKHTRVVYATVVVTPGVEKWPFRGYATRPELSVVGMEAAFDFGQKLRKRYVENLHLLPRRHRPEEESSTVLATSLDDTRAYDTMQLLLLGLYPDDVALNSARTKKDCKGCRPARRSLPFDVPLALALDVAGGSVALNATEYDPAVGKTSPQCLGACMGLRLRHGDGDAIYDDSEEAARLVQPVNITVRPLMYDNVLRQAVNCGDDWFGNMMKRLRRPPWGVTLGGEFSKALDLVHEQFVSNVSNHLCAAIGYSGECANVALRDLGALHDVVASHLVLGGDWDLPLDRRDVLASLAAPKQHLLWEIYGRNTTATAGVLLRQIVEGFSSAVAMREFGFVRRIVDGRPHMERLAVEREKVSIYTVSDFQAIALLGAIGIQPYTSTFDPMDSLTFEVVEEGDASLSKEGRDGPAVPPPADPRVWPISQRHRRMLRQYAEYQVYSKFSRHANAGYENFMDAVRAGKISPPPPDTDVFMPDGSLNVSHAGAILLNGTWNETFVYEHNRAVPLSPPPPAPPPPVFTYDQSRFRYWLMVRHNDKPVKLPGCQPPRWARAGSDHSFLCDIDIFGAHIHDVTNSPTVEVCGGYQTSDEVYGKLAAEAAAEEKRMRRYNLTAMSPPPPVPGLQVQTKPKKKGKRARDAKKKEEAEEKKKLKMLKELQKELGPQEFNPY